MRLLHCLLSLAPLLSSCERDGAALEGEIARGVTVSRALVAPAPAAPAPAAPTPAAAAAAAAATETTTDPAPRWSGSETSEVRAELPRTTVNTALPAVTGRTITVAAGGDLQAALDAARPGDEVVLRAGATFKGAFKLRDKGASTAWITVRSSGTLPAPGTRVTPAHAPQMARLVPPHPSERALETEAGAHHWRLIGLEVTGAPGQSWGYSLLNLGGNGENSLARMSHHLVLDRMWVHGSTTMDFQRCISLNSAHTAIVDSWISDCHSRQHESHAIGGWEGAGPYRIENNYLAASGINLLLGGATPTVRGLVPSDIEIRRNHFHKPASWLGVWSVKNLFELKNAQRVLVEGNVFENNWSDAQVGFAIVWKSSADVDAPWTVVQDVTFRYNILRNSSAGLNLAARPDGPAQPARRFRIENNLFEDIGDFGGRQNGRMLMLLGDLQDVAFERNTFLHDDWATHLIIMDGDKGRNLVFRNNVATRGAYGVFGSGASEGTASLDAFWGSNWTFDGNVLVGGNVALDRYPRGTTTAADIATVGFINPAGADYRLRSTSRYRGAGADFAAIHERTAGVAAAVERVAP